MIFALYPNIGSAQNDSDAELNRLWNQAEFWEKAGNTAKTIEYKEKLVELYRKHYVAELPLILRNIANTYGSLSEPYWNKSEKYFKEALLLISKREISDNNLTLYYNCLFDLIGWNFERKEYINLLKNVETYSKFIIDNSGVNHEEDIENIKKAKYNTISLLNDSCLKLNNDREYEKAFLIMDSYVQEFVELLSKNSVDENISNLCIFTVWQYAVLLEHLDGQIEKSLALYELHNRYIRNNLDFYLRTGLSIDYLWVMERYLANKYYDLGYRQKDIEISEQIVKDARIYNDSLLLSDKLIDLGVSYERDHTLEGRKNAQPFFEESLNILTELNNHQNVESRILQVLELLLGEYVLCGQYNKVIETCSLYKDILNKEYISTEESLLMEILRWKSSALNYLNFSPIGSREEAQTINKKILDYKRKSYGEQSVQYLAQLRLSSLAYQYSDTLELDDIFSAGYRLWENIQGKEEMKDYTSFLGTYINYLYHRNNKEAASVLSKKMELLFSLGKADFHTIVAYYYNCSVNAYNNCDYDLAHKYNEQALLECEKHRINSEIEERIAMILCHKANIAFCMGMFDVAKDCSYTAYNILEQYDNDNLLKSDILYSLSLLMDNFGETGKATDLSIEAFNIAYKCEGVFMPLDKVSSTIQRFDSKTQISLIDTLHIENFLNDPLVVDLFVIKAAAYISLRDFTSAEHCLLDAERYLDVFKGSEFFEIKEHYNMLKSQILYNKGVLAFWRGKYNDAISYFTDYRNVAVLDGPLPWLNTSYSIIKDSCNFNKETQISLNYIRKEVSERFIYLGDHERELYMTNKLFSAISEIESYADIYPESTYAREAAFNAVLLEKGLALSASSEIQNIMHNSSIETEYLISLKKQLGIAADQESRSSIQLKISLEEQKIQSSIGPLISNQINNLLVDVNDVKKHLDSQSAVVEFIKILTVNDSVPIYGALILTKDFVAPVYVKIGSENQLENLKTNGAYIYSQDNQIAYNIIWKPILQHLKGKKFIYFSPTGMLHLLNIELIAQNHHSGVDFVRLSSARELCNDGNQIAKGNNVILFGGLCYDCESKDSLYTTTPVYFESARDSVTRSGISFLPGSLDEINNISKIATLNSTNSIVYSGEEGSEYNYKLLSDKDIHILHLSTHGFSLGNSTIAGYGDPMRKCGLLMSGAQKAWDGFPIQNMEDGILLGEEIANVQLHKNELIVLSACESALGVTTSEGVWGLQRSFKKAGGKAILMSLWKVNDYSTKMLMMEFYKNYLTGVSKRESLKRAQRYVKEFQKEDGDKPFLHPIYWAAWVILDAIN